ncbi:MAG: hypothetical protein PHS73_00820 [Candidatus Peribacteraceae bacterium]|nr:hypothetical protein [Candidatus Peribacteraceae bacterium]
MPSESRQTQGRLEAALVVLTAFLLISLYYAFWHADLLFDEVMHYPRILGIAEWRLQDVQWGVMLPGYHFLVGGMLGLLGVHSIAVARAVSFLVSAAAVIGGAFLVARSLDRSSFLLRTLQVAVFPLLLPVLPLLYTDSLSLGLVLLTLWAALRNRVPLSAILLTLAILVRQNNVLWMPLLAGIVLMRGTYSALSRDGYFRLWPFLLPCLVLALFLIIHRSPALNFSAFHPIGFFPGNIFFALALAAGIFPSLIIGQAGRIMALLHTHRKWLLVILFFLFLFHFAFTVSHPFNQDPQFWRNRVLLAVTQEWLPWVLFAFAMVLALLTMAVTRLAVRGAGLLYPCSLVYLGASWLIDARYALIPLVLFLLLRERRSWKEEVMQYAWQVVVCMWIFV